MRGVLISLAIAGWGMGWTGVWAQQLSPIERVKISDAEASCLQLHNEVSEMDKISTEARAAQEKSGTAATAAGAANVAADVVGRTGGFFGAFGSVLGGIAAQAATQGAANVAQQSAQQSAQQHAERAKQAQARKEHLVALFLNKGCKVSDLGAPGRAMTPEEMHKLTNSQQAFGTAAAAQVTGPGVIAAPAGSAPPPAVDIPDLDPKEYLRPLPSEAAQSLQKTRRIAIGGFRVAFVTKAVAADNIRASYLGAGTHTSGVSTKIELTLKNIELQRMQALTEEAYREFLARLKEAGVDVVPFEQFAQHKSFSEMKFAGKDGHPYVVETGGRSYTVLSPQGMKLWFGQAEPLGDQGIFGVGNWQLAGDFAFDNKLTVVNPMLVLDFAETSAGRNKGIFGLRNRTQVSATSAISLRSGNGMSQLTFISRFAPIASAFSAGFSPMVEPVMFAGDYGKLVTVEQNTNRGLVVGLGALGLSGGPVRELQRSEIVADPASYSALAGGALQAGSRLFARSIADLLK